LYLPLLLPERGERGEGRGERGEDYIIANAN